VSTAIFDFIDVSNLPIADVKSSDPYLIVHLTPSTNDRKWKTKRVKNTVNPEWKERREFCFAALEDEILSIAIWDKTRRMTTKC
jgi:Ca2+-dependent lipid-binding protein